MALSFPYDLVERQESEALFRHDGSEAFWDAFRARYPDTAGIITLSRVGGNAEMTQGLVYWEGACCDTGGGSIFLLSRIDGARAVQKWKQVWMS